jgi:hypothetical protein
MDFAHEPLVVKRVVLEHSFGARAGLREIIGTVDQLPTIPNVGTLCPLSTIDSGFIRLTRHMPHYILFTEVAAPTAASPT